MAWNRERSKKAERNLCTSLLCSSLSGCSSLDRGDRSLKAAGRTRSSRAIKEEVGGNGGLYAGDATFFPNLSIVNIVRQWLWKKLGLQSDWFVKDSFEKFRAKGFMQIRF
jgi:hypothetical protein